MKFKRERSYRNGVKYYRTLNGDANILLTLRVFPTGEATLNGIYLNIPAPNNQFNLLFSSEERARAYAQENHS